MAGRRSEQVLVTTLQNGVAHRRPDDLIVEEPLTVQLDGTTVTTTMRTPGHDFELATGFCFTEGLLNGVPVLRCRYCASGAPGEYNVVSVETGGKAPPPAVRLVPTTSACGVCGTASVDGLSSRLSRLPHTEAVPPRVMLDVIDAVSDRQELFRRTGAVHGAAAFNTSGEVLVVREDIGRHNAVDKVIGAMLLGGDLPDLPARGLGLFVSGRASFEMVQKAWAGGFGTVVAVSAPSSLAVTMARTANLTLAGFVRGGRITLYSPLEPPRPWP